LSGANIATPLLFRIFNTIDYDADEEWFNQPSDCNTRIVCSESGLVPGEHCSNLVTDFYIPMISPVKKCEHLQEIMVSPDEKISYCRLCMPANGYKKKLYRAVSPEIEEYFEENHIAFDKIPPHNPNCEKIFRDGGPILVSPSNGNEYLINRQNPEPLLLYCQTGNDVERVYWYINDRYYKSCQPNAKLFFLPEEGPIKISCSDDKGRNKEIHIRVRHVSL
jgi:penicillin-binding protein 1C